jgi:hypothetical protein
MGGQSEVAVLIKEKGEVVHGFTVKPWTLNQVIQLAPVLEDLVKNLQDRGVTFDNFDSVLTTINSWAFSISQILTPGGSGTIQITPPPGPSFWDLIKSFLPVLPGLLAISLRISPEEAGELDAPKAALLSIKVVQYNLEHIKNFFGLTSGEGLVLKQAKKKN